MENSVLMMAFASGSVSTESNVVKKYTGVAPVYVLAVNPKKAELEKLYNTQLENEPEYVGEVDVNGTKYPNVRIDFIVKTDEEKCGIDFTTKVTFFLRKQFKVNRDETKVQVIDKYGRTAWLTKEEYQNKEIPTYKNGPALLDKDYRPCYVGEEDLTNFIIAYLNIPMLEWRTNGELVKNTKVSPVDCEARLDKIEDYFKGDFSELNYKPKSKEDKKDPGVIYLQPMNKVKALFGVRTTDDNKQYQAVYTNMFLKNNANDTAVSRLDKDLQERKANGAYPTTEFIVGDLKEYNIESTNFNNNERDMPFGAPAADSPWGFN